MYNFQALESNEHQFREARLVLVPSEDEGPRHKYGGRDVPSEVAGPNSEQRERVVLEDFLEGVLHFFSQILHAL